MLLKLFLVTLVIATTALWAKDTKAPDAADAGTKTDSGKKTRDAGTVRASTGGAMFGPRGGSGAPVTYDTPPLPEPAKTEASLKPIVEVPAPAPTPVPPPGPTPPPPPAPPPPPPPGPIPN